MSNGLKPIETVVCQSKIREKKLTLVNNENIDDKQMNEGYIEWVLNLQTLIIFLALI